MKPCCIAALILAVSSTSASADLKFKDDFLKRLIKRVPSILKAQDPKTGKFGEGIWICRDQHPIYPLAVAWASKSADNPYYHDPKVLDAIMSGGDALIEGQDKEGKWRFDKKDGSFWGMTYMPWTYSRWIRAFDLVRESMPADRRKRWEDALTLGFTGISTTALGHVHNIPTHHAMSIYIAGKALSKPEWCEQAKEFMAKVVAAQDPGGFWVEHYGPVVQYNFVYVDALGTYYAASGDKAVLPALERSSEFHAAFTYPDGTCVETIDERNPHSENVRLGNVGFTFSPEGRGYTAQQLDIIGREGDRVSDDDLASYILYGEEGSTKPTAAGDRDRTFVMTDKKALIRRKGPWFVCLSAYACEIPPSRWHEDRQNLVSVFHDKTGLIIGGGNTKLQPLWSTFTVGDTSLLKHKPGDENPKFTPDGPLLHVPSEARLAGKETVGLDLIYGKETCKVRIEPVDDTKLRLILTATADSDQPVAAHLTLIPHLDKPFTTERGTEKDLSKDGFTLASDSVGKWIAHSGWRITVPEGASVTWPALPHNPYVKDGSAKLEEGRIVISVPFSRDHSEQTLELTITE